MLSQSSNTNLLSGVIVSLTTHGESNLIIRCFSKEAGKFSCYVRGGLNSTKRFSGKLDFLDYRTFELDSSKKEGSYYLSASAIIKHFSDLSTNIRKFEAACFIAEVADKLIHEGDPGSIFLFDPFIEALESLQGASSVKECLVISSSFLIKVLVHEGYDPISMDVEDLKIYIPNNVDIDIYEIKVYLGRIFENLDFNNSSKLVRYAALMLLIFSEHYLSVRFNSRSFITN